MQKSEIQIVDFEAEHFRRITLRPEDALDIRGIDEEQLLKAWAGARTLLCNGQVVLFYGSGIHQGTGYLWTVTSALAQRLPLLITRLGQGLVRSLFNSGCHRVEAFCHCDNHRSLNWLQRCLGFQIEGLLRQSGPNRQNRYILSIVREH
ncbi:GNAT family N-acetyltransferase [Desulfovibrio sp. OttesenSCG-928-F20]|nr:GNAT family N-acetyltransferase [Desulfovibrio sp. OttesenSCG-928-F20]